MNVYSSMYVNDSDVNGYSKFYQVHIQNHAVCFIWKLPKTNACQLLYYYVAVLCSLVSVLVCKAWED